MQRREIAAAAALLAVDVALTVALVAHAWAHPTSITIGRRTDAPYTVWAFAWVARALAHGQSPWVSHALSAPNGVNLMTNATVTGVGLVLAPLTWLWGPLVSFDVAATAAFALTAWSAQLVIRRAGVASWPAAAVGGVVAGLGPLSLAQEGGAHLHVTSAFLIPPLLLGVGRLVTGTARHATRWAFAVGVLAAAQILVGEEVLALTTIAIVIALVVLLAMRVPVHANRREVSIAVVTFAVLAAGPLWVQFFGPDHINGAIQNGAHYPNDLTALFAPPTTMWWAPHWLSKLTYHVSSEGGVYLGVPLVIVAVVSAVRGSRLVRVIGWTALVMTVLSFGVHLTIDGHDSGIPLPWRVFAGLPLLRSLIPVRFGLLLDFAAGALLAAALDAAAAFRPRRHSRHVALATPCAIAVVCLAPLVPKLPFPTSRWSVPALFRAPGGAHIPDGALVVLGPYPGVSVPQVEMWLAVAGDRWRSAGGSYFVPKADGDVTIGGPAPVPEVVESDIERGMPLSSVLPLRAVVSAALLRDHVAAVLIGPVAHRATAVSFWSLLLGPPEAIGGMEVWHSPVLRGI